MTEPFSFSKNLTLAFKVFSKEHGFRKKGVKYTKQFKNHIGEIYFQRSSWNLPNMPFEMYINIGFQSIGHDRLDKPLYSSIQKHHLSLQSQNMDRLEEKQKKWDALLKAEPEKVKQYFESNKWTYKSEKQLIDQFKVAEKFLSEYVEEIFTKANKK